MEPQVKAKVIEHPQRDETSGFDYRVQVKDAKTGKMIRLQHYTRHTKGEQVLLELPVGSGNCFLENGEPAGRYKFHVPKDSREVVWEKISDKHVEVAAAPIDQMDYLAQKNEALEKELAALRAEAEALAKKHPALK